MSQYVDSKSISLASLSQDHFWKDVEKKIIINDNVTNEREQCRRLMNHCFKEGFLVRDPVGATLLHWSLLQLEVRSDLPKFLIEELDIKYINLTYSRYDDDVHYECDSDYVRRPRKKNELQYHDLLFDGESAVHLAIALKATEILNLLIERKASLTERAFGSFFAPGGKFYFGELPLSFAVCTDNYEAAEILLKENPMLLYQRDTFGNTAFHIAVIRSKMGFYDWLVDIYRQGRLKGMPKIGAAEEEIKNDTEDGDEPPQIIAEVEIAEYRGLMGLTPLSLAALHEPESRATGSNVRSTAFENSLYSHIQESTKREFWSWMGISCRSYNLEQIDTQNRSGFVPLLYLTYQFKLHHLAHEPVMTLLMDEKWKSIKVPYHASIVMHVLYMGLLTVLVIKSHPTGEIKTPLGEAGLIFSCLFLFTSVVDFILGVYDLRKYLNRSPEPLPNDSAKYPPKAWETYCGLDRRTVSSSYSVLTLLRASVPLDIFDFIAVTGNLLFVIAYCYREDAPLSISLEQSLLGLNNTTSVSMTSVPDLPIPDVPVSLVLLGFAAMCAWLSVLRFSAAHERTGMLVQVVLSTIGRDLLPFIIVFSLFLMATASSVFTLQKDHSLLYSIDALIRLALGIYEHESYQPVGHSGFAEDLSYVLMVAFAVVCGLLLINLLIATFTSTYENIEDSARESWLIQMGHNILLIERRLSLFSFYRNKLRMNHDTGDKAVVVFISEPTEGKRNASKTAKRTSMLRVEESQPTLTVDRPEQSISSSVGNPLIRKDNEQQPQTPDKKKSSRKRRKKKKPESASPAPTPSVESVLPPNSVQSIPETEQPSDSKQHKFKCECGMPVTFNTPVFPLRVTCPECNKKYRFTSPDDVLHPE